NNGHIIMINLIDYRTNTNSIVETVIEETHSIFIDL
ncbi:MAG: hypothetical protein ACI90V_011090, partial [Bacillariaceae sp.]